MTFSSYADYAQLIFHLLADHPMVASHTLAVYTINRTVGITRGEVIFHSGHVLRVFEQIDFVAHRIVKYSYEFVREGDALWWYDSMPHPNVPDLRSTHPHHKHIPPDIKHHRIPAPEMSFAGPNLPTLLTQIEQIVSRP
jgi:hypothetical protein